MQTVTVLRQLWQLRPLVVLLACVAVCAGTAVVYELPSLESRRYDAGVATARMLVDTPDSQIVDVSPKGSDTLGARANLLANLMVDGEMKTAIARRAGLRPEQVVGIAETAAGAAAGLPSDRRAFVLRTKTVTATAGDRLPIVEIETEAAGAAAATRLANAAVAGVRDTLDRQAARDRVSARQRLRVSGLGVAQARVAPRGPRLIVAFGVAFLVFASGCAALLGIVTLRRMLRETPAGTARVDALHAVRAAHAAPSGDRGADELRVVGDAR
jgi:hypothetical protein